MSELSDHHGADQPESGLPQLAHQPQLEWREGGVPVSTRFADPYFSLSGGLAEARHVFLAGNDLPARLREGFHVAELGFGTGLNCLALAQVARMPLRMTSFEAFPMDVAQLQRAHAAFPELGDLAGQLRASWGQRVMQVGHLRLELVIGDVAQTLPRWPGRADAWFLDGFSPAKNPGMWTDEVMAQVGRHSAPCASLATYTAAGHVRRALEQAGFEVQRRPGFGHKRHMTVGRIGAGRAGALAPRRDGPLDGGRNGAPPAQR